MTRRGCGTRQRRRAAPVRSIGLASCIALTFALILVLPAASSPKSNATAARDVVQAIESGASALSVEHDGTWINWWNSDAAPTHWSGPLAAITGSITWHRSADPAVAWGEFRLSGSGEAWRIRVIVASIDPARARIGLDSAFRRSSARADWTIDRAPPDAIVAVNAGQFVGSSPWGWVMVDGREFLRPGNGPLATAIAIDTAGTLHWFDSSEMQSARNMRGVVDAFQSYPALLRADGDVPGLLQPDHTNGEIDLTHRDARLAIGQRRDGRIVVALTRFDALDGALDYVPFGLTTPEMAAVMGALGCREAVMLDGGISSQMMIRTASGERRRWAGVRRVPLGLVVLPRAGASRSRRVQ